MKITQIKELKKCGIYRDFKWGTELPDFGRFNLIYGQNGSGKTTLSRVLQDLELQRTPDYEVLISTDKPSRICGVDFYNAKVPIRVFNSEFVSKNVFTVEGRDVPPIIVLGTKNKDELDRLTKKREELKDVKNEHTSNQNNKNNAEQSFDYHCKSQSKDIKNMLAGPDDNIYRNYNKAKYREQATSILKNNNQSMYKLDAQTRKRLMVLHRTTPRREIKEPRYPRRNLAALRGTVVDLLSWEISSKTIQSLMGDTDKAEWIRRGMDFDSNGECPFCENQMPKQRMLDLENYFNMGYKDVMISLEGLDAHIRNLRESFLTRITAPDCEIVHDSLHDRYMEAKSELDEYRDHVNVYLDSLVAAISRKRHYLFKSIAPNDILQPPDNQPPDTIIEIIREHNEMCSNLTFMVADARKKLECDHIVNDYEFMRLRNNFLDASRAAEESAKRMTALTDEISKMERDMANHSRAAYDFNKDLRSYLGHEELYLDVREHGYAISRNGDASPLPSEGEKTAIALLYFLQSLKRDGFDIKKGIIVLDDPVSSLDANALFAAVGFIQDRTQTAGQLFVLTHNFTLFREVRGWFKSKNHNGRRDAQFYMLGSSLKDGSRQSEIRKLDPLLRDYGSDYHYLFKCIWYGAKSSDSLEFNYHLPNMARRLLDSFLAFRQPNITSFGGRMDKVEFDKAKKRRITAFINAHSHNFAIAEPEHTVGLLSEAPAVLSDIMDLMKAVDSKHYDLMENLVKKS